MNVGHRVVALAYAAVFRLVLLRLDPETAHALAVAAIRVLGSRPIAPLVSRLTRPPRDAGVQALGLVFRSPFGLAAGFDKDARAVAGLRALGFSHVEVGTITPRPQPGNPKPRLFRLPADHALINRMGFNNDGADAVAARLHRLRSSGRAPVVGVNIGKNRDTALDDAAADYASAARTLAPVADYLVVNVSSPNTPGLRGLQELDRLEPVLVATADAADGVPLLVKIAPDLDDESIRRIGDLVERLGLAGVVATNTTLARTGLRTSQDALAGMGDGGLSGTPLAPRADEVLAVLRSALAPSRCVISVGGVLTPADVRRRMDAGATLVQGYTGFLYRGPAWAAELARA